MSVLADSCTSWFQLLLEVLTTQWKVSNVSLMFPCSYTIPNIPDIFKWVHGFGFQCLFVPGKYFNL